MRGEKDVLEHRKAARTGSPPHARGKDDFWDYLVEHSGITPACAGKRKRFWQSKNPARDHPRMRGEKQSPTLRPAGLGGSPPHARGKVLRNVAMVISGGITPACAGKRWERCRRSLTSRDHPRMRGEKVHSYLVWVKNQGSPPHARGKGREMTEEEWSRGITPACAGKRRAQTRPACPPWDHPRMRGEKNYRNTRDNQMMGSPPHARGKAQVQFLQRQGGGITPACAGKSVPRAHDHEPWWDHPRMRGEKSFFGWLVREELGSPPHARGKDLAAVRAAGKSGITPACAGKRVIKTCINPNIRDHPRMRGEKRNPAGSVAITEGSPPHARGKD